MKLVRIGLALLFVCINGFNLYAQQKKNQKSDAFRILQLLAQEDYKTVIEESTKFILANPANFSGYFWRAEAYDKLGDIHNSKIDLYSVINLRPDFTNAYTNLGYIYQKSEQHDSALFCYENALKYGEFDTDEEKSYLYYNKALVHLEMKNPTIAYQDLKTANEYLPNDPYILYQLGLLEIDNGNYKLARSHFLTVQLKRPDQIEARLNIAICKYNLEDYDGAFKDVNTYLSVSSDKGYAYFLKAKLYDHYYLDDEKALEYYTLSIEFGYNYSYLNRAMKYMELDDFNAAESDLLNWKQYNSFNPIIWMMLTSIYIETERLETANSYFEELVNSYSHSQDTLVEMYLLKVELLFENGFDNEAIKDLHFINELYPNDTKVLNKIIHIMYLNGEYDLVIDKVSDLIDLEPDNHDLIVYRARVYSRINNYVASEKDYSRVIELQPSLSEYYFSRGLIRLKLKKRKEACSDFNKAASMGNIDAQYALNDECR